MKLKGSRWRTALPVLFLVTVFGGAFWFWLGVGDNRGYAPDQPIPFSHEIHAGQFKIDCQYCHSGVDKSRHATLPSMNVCLNCHSVVKGDSPHIQRLKALVAEGESFEWVKVHDMPDYVFFNHKRHIAKGVACEKCHGDVRQMKKIKQVEMLNMGFCVQCHKENKVTTSCDTCHH